MAATCEISNVFSNYFNAMYSSEDPALAPAPPSTTFGAEDLMLTLNNPQMSLGGPGERCAAGYLERQHTHLRGSWLNG